MGLETFTGYIDSLDIQNPTPTDEKRQGDDHIRGVKKTLAVTFSGFTEDNVSVDVLASEINAVCAGGASQRMPTGMVAPFAMIDEPTGWLLCNGQTVNRDTYATLFGVIGTTWGEGNGSTTFKLPDLRGAFVRGWSDDSQTLDANRVFASFQDEEVITHDHGGITATHTHDHGGETLNGGEHAHSYDTHVHTGTGGYTGGSQGDTPASLLTDSAGTHRHPIPDDTHQHFINPTGGDETRPVNFPLQYCIKT